MPLASIDLTDQGDLRWVIRSEQGGIPVLVVRTRDACLTFSLHQGRQLLDGLRAIEQQEQETAVLSRNLRAAQRQGA